ncbi:hypothetical protein RRG08_054092 [Elysia crispata]|uniref:Uncharacterized protein n=1 Tax=Elysia crispata TaxID=231223 RepID=A0AAE0ZCS1_9GAST|nr:hypothetical protein RRG08_054092 [Elysia crispata]
MQVEAGRGGKVREGKSKCYDRLEGRKLPETMVPLGILGIHNAQVRNEARSDENHLGFITLVPGRTANFLPPRPEFAQPNKRLAG